MVDRSLHAFERAANVPAACAIGPRILDRQSGEHHPFMIAKRNAITRGECVWDGRVEVERHRGRPDGVVRQTAVVRHGLVLGLRHEAAKRREGAVQEQLEIAELMRCEVDRGPATRFRTELRGALGRNEELLGHD